MTLLICIVIYIITTILMLYFAKDQMVFEPIHHYSKFQNVLRMIRQVTGILLLGWLLIILFITFCIIVMIAGTIDKMFDLGIID